MPGGCGVFHCNGTLIKESYAARGNSSVVAAIALLERNQDIAFYDEAAEKVYEYRWNWKGM